MNREPVTSSNITSIGFELNADYDPKNARGTLEVEFAPKNKTQTRGEIWRYYDVPAALRVALMVAPSIGSFFHKAVRMGNFRSEKVERRDFAEVEALYRSWDRDALLGMRVAVLSDQAAMLALADPDAVDLTGENRAWFAVRLSLIDRIVTERGW